MTELARCAAHPDVPASETCARCGDYYCRGCADPRHASVCIRCGERLPSGIAWEDRRHGVLPWRWLKTVAQMVLRPRVAFPGPARFGASLGFAAACGLAIGVLLVSIGAALLVPPDGLLRQLLGGRTPALLGLSGAFVLGVPVGFTVAWTAASGLSFAAGLASVGRSRGALRFGLRACGYAQAITLLAVLVPFCFALPAQLVGDSRLLFQLGHASWIASSLVWPLLTGRVCFWAGRGLGLDTSRAMMAAIGPTFACAPLAAFVTDQQLELLAQSAALGV